VRIIFCNDVLSPQLPDQAFAHEAEVSIEQNFNYSLIDFERLVDGDNAVAATRRVRATEDHQLALYRGWMLRPRQYEQLYAALQEKGWTLFNTPQAYRHCHYLPESYSIIQAQTPATVWLPLGEFEDFDLVMQALARFGDKPLILKDYVKSRKHDWAEACFIPSAGNREAVEQVVRRFIELQGEQLQGGLVFREFVDLQPTGTHPQSGMPLTKEFRLFFLDKELLMCLPYWKEASYATEQPPLEQFKPIASQIASRFFTMDVAQTVEGNWIIVELGDGQVAGLPDDKYATDFYTALKHRIGNHTAP
jgi:hypothetical protein